MSSLIRTDAASRFVPISNRGRNFEQQPKKNQANEDHDRGEGAYLEHTGVEMPHVVRREEEQSSRTVVRGLGKERRNGDR